MCSIFFFGSPLLSYVVSSVGHLLAIGASDKDDAMSELHCDDEHFQSIAQAHGTVVEREIDQYSDDIIDITLEEVKAVLKDLPNNKCEGSDRQPYELYKYSGEEGARVVWRLLRRLFAEETSPDQWHTTNQILVLLKDGDPTDVGNKRGIGVGQPALRKNL